MSLAAAVLAVATLPGCEALKDTEPWTATVVYSEEIPGQLTVKPLEIQADSGFGEVQVVNDSGEEHGFAITDHEAAIFEKIPAGKTRTVQVTELKNNRTYRFYCQKHDKEDVGTDEFFGRIVVKYLSEEFR